MPLSRVLPLLLVSCAVLMASPAAASSHRYSTRYRTHSSSHGGHRTHYGSGQLSHRSSHRTYYRSGYRSHHTSHRAHYSSGRHTRRYAYGVARDKRGHIKRSESAKRRFERKTGYPHGRKGYVVDHIVPLSKGGTDDPSNMQWQTVDEAKAKDRTERGH